MYAYVYVTCSLLSMDALLACPALTHKIKNVWKESLPTCTSRLNRKIWTKNWMAFAYSTQMLSICSVWELCVQHCVLDHLHIRSNSFQNCIIRLFIFMRWWQSSISRWKRIYFQTKKLFKVRMTQILDLNSLGFPLNTSVPARKFSTFKVYFV